MHTRVYVQVACARTGYIVDPVSPLVHLFCYRAMSAPTTPLSAKYGKSRGGAAGGMAPGLSSLTGRLSGLEEGGPTSNPRRITRRASTGTFRTSIGTSRCARFRCSQLASDAPSLASTRVMISVGCVLVYQVHFFVIMCVV